MNVYDFLTIWWAHFEWLVRQLDWLVVFGAILIFGAAYVFLRMSRNPGSTFDFAEMFEGDNGKTSMAKFGAFIAMLTSTWIVVSLTVAKSLTDLTFGAYLGLLVAGKVASEYVSRRDGDDRG